MCTLSYSRRGLYELKEMLSRHDMGSENRIENAFGRQRGEA